MSACLPRLPRLSRVAAALLVVLVSVACGSTTGSRGGSGSPTGGGSPSSSPSGQSIGHASGAADLVLRVEQVGGFIAPAFLITRLPTFSLYGDGTVIVEDPIIVPMVPPPDGLDRHQPLRVLHLDETGIQRLLATAIGPGALGIAKDHYQADRIADAPSTVFTVHTTDLQKTVTVDALGIDLPNAPDAAIRRAFSDLIGRLTSLASSGVAYQPASYRGILQSGAPQGGAAAVAWPWPAIKPSDFRAPNANMPDLTIRPLTAADVADLKLSGIEGGIDGIPLVGPNGVGRYSLSLRPLLPDETS